MKRERFQNHLLKYRKERGYSQKHVAFLLGHKDNSQVCNWEKGVKIPSLKNAIKIAVIYHKPITFLFYYYFSTSREEIRVREERWNVKRNYYHV